MSKRVVIDPITRIEGHLRIEVELDENNVVESRNYHERPYTL